MYQPNPLLEGSESVRMLMATKKALNNAKAKVAYHNKMTKIYATKMADMVETDGALMDKVVFSSLRKSQRHHIKMAQQYENSLENLGEKLTDIRLSMGLIR